MFEIEPWSTVRIPSTPELTTGVVAVVPVVVVVVVVVVIDPLSDARVSGPTYPDAEIPFAVWYFITAAFVRAPKYPVADTPSFVWRAETSAPEEPTVRSFEKVAEAVVADEETAAIAAAALSGEMIPRLIKSLTRSFKDIA
jgi:hypothetical protein